MSKVYANGRTVVHQGDGLVNTDALPDVCKTPSPGGPVPIPYVNVARDGDLANGSTSVSIEGSSVALKDSNLSTSSGDEPGTAGGGIISSKTKGKMTWANASFDVKIEGQGVVRFLEPTQHNGNTFNSTFTQQGGTGLGYGDDPLDHGKCPRCEQDKPTHVILETPESLSMAMALFGKLEWVRANRSHLQTLKPGKRGYMIGVLFCKGIPSGQGKIFAAKSGSENDPPGFKRAVRLLNKEDSRWTRCGQDVPGDEHDLDDGVTQKKPKEKPPELEDDGSGTIDFNRVRNSLGPIPGGQAYFEALYARVPLIPDPTNPGKFLSRNEPGVCAAPKLIQKALDEGHHPLNMTEIWYSPAASIAVKTVVFDMSPQATASPQAAPQIQAFGSGQSVPSCLTCQVQLTPMLCGSADATCP
ncbi:MAG: DUF4150 domain-containing protein [Hyalangium sp.]|uniref:DUF4150 domain-containing protein n=1 Tax=Hyalangium sp. TaxID=2028555 RepID=UPI003899A21D